MRAAFFLYAVEANIGRHSNVLTGRTSRVT